MANTTLPPKRQAHSQRWHNLTRKEASELFDSLGDDLTILPNEDIYQELRDIQSATLEVVENRTASTVYRIRQTGIIYQLCQPNGDIFIYDDMDDYMAESHIDELVESYIIKPVRFTAQEASGKLLIYHHGIPKMTLQISADGSELTPIGEIDWSTTQPDVMHLAKVLRKAGAWYLSYRQP